jgi:hypothetical protein
MYVHKFGEGWVHGYVVYVQYGAHDDQFCTILAVTISLEYVLGVPANRSGYVSAKSGWPETLFRQYHGMRSHTISESHANYISLLALLFLFF